MKTAHNASIAFHDYQPERDDFLKDVLLGLSKPQKQIPAKYFYDEDGSALFDAICDLDEYYPTRTEIGLLKQHSTQIAELIGARCIVIEYGSGSSQKIPILLACLNEPLAYMPIDICKEYLLESSGRIAAYQPGMDVIAICADYTKPMCMPASHKYSDAKKVIFFPGSTIGNCTPLEAIRLLKNAAQLVGKGGGMLIGVDLKKDTAILHAAYNDRKEITAEFNLNILARINRELSANFNLSAFHHHAFYNHDHGRIEMHLISQCEQLVTVSGRVFHFSENESIHTENSYKYTIDEFQSMARVARFIPCDVWVDEHKLFSLHYLRAA